MLSLFDKAREVRICQFAVAHTIQIDFFFSLSVRNDKNLQKDATLTTTFTVGMLPT